MPAYHQIETHIKLIIPNNFPILLKKFENVLSRMGLINEEVKQWLENISWDIPQDGFVYFPDVPGIQLIRDKVSLSVRPSILGITPLILEELKDNWVSLELLIPSGEIDNFSMYPIIRYQNEPIKIVVEMMRIVASEFPESPIFLTDEAQDGQPWLGEIRNNNENLWFFEIANVPSSLQIMVTNPNKQFHVWKENHRTWFARKYAFPKPPWN